MLSGAWIEVSRPVVVSNASACMVLLSSLTRYACLPSGANTGFFLNTASDREESVFNIPASRGATLRNAMLMMMAFFFASLVGLVLFIPIKNGSIALTAYGPLLAVVALIAAAGIGYAAGIRTRKM